MIAIHPRHGACILHHTQLETLFFAKEDVCPSFPMRPMLFALELRSISHPLSLAACTAKPSQWGSQTAREGCLRFVKLVSVQVTKLLDLFSATTCGFGIFLIFFDILWLVIQGRAQEIEPQLIHFCALSADRETSWAMARN